MCLRRDGGLMCSELVFGPSLRQETRHCLGSRVAVVELGEYSAKGERET